MNTSEKKIRVMAGTFFGYPVFIEVLESDAEFVRAQWLKHSQRMMEDEKIAAAVRMQEEISLLGKNV